MIKRILHNEQLLAIIISAHFRKDGVEFFTPNDFSQQLAYMNRPKDYKIKPHIHKQIERNISFTQEVLIIRTGKIKVDFYSNDKQYCQSEILLPGDVILLASGGHGFTMLEDTEMIEVKQGPYSGVDGDKIHF